MKIWKMVGSLVLLAVIICGCVILGQSMENTDGDGLDPDAPSNVTEAPESEKDAGKDEDNTPTPDSSVTVTKTYSTGLAFRSNGDGTCAVSGIGSCTSVCILIPPESPTGDKVIEILPYAFADTIVGAIELPATLTTLTADAFARCERLALVRVEAENESFLEYDGLLYSADGKTLIYCPSARSATQLQLHDNLRRVAAGAFAACSTLGTVYFNGTSAEWHALIVGDGNEALYAAVLKFKA